MICNHKTLFFDKNERVYGCTTCGQVDKQLPAGYTATDLPGVYTNESLMKLEFRNKLDEVCEGMDWLVEHWNENWIKQYPTYLPSFDEFVADLRAMLDEKD